MELNKWFPKITMLEDDNDLQDFVLTIHHAYMHTLSMSSSAKIIEKSVRPCHHIQPKIMMLG